MNDGSKQVSVTVDDSGNVVSIMFSGEKEPRDLSRPNGHLPDKPIVLDDYDNLVGFETVTVLAFKNSAGMTRICVKRMNCDYFCF